MIKGNSIQLSAHFTYKKMFRFVLAPICTMLFTSIYGIVDGFLFQIMLGIQHLHPSIWLCRIL